MSSPPLPIPHPWGRISIHPQPLPVRGIRLHPPSLTTGDPSSSRCQALGPPAKSARHHQVPLSSLLCSHVQLTHGPIALMDHQTDVLGPGGAGERRGEPLRLQPKPVGGVMEPKTLLWKVVGPKSTENKVHKQEESCGWLGPWLSSDDGLTWVRVSHTWLWDRSPGVSWKSTSHYLQGSRTPAFSNIVCGWKTAAAACISENASGG